MDAIWSSYRESKRPVDEIDVEVVQAEILQGLAAIPLDIVRMCARDPALDDVTWKKNQRKEKIMHGLIA